MSAVTLTVLDAARGRVVPTTSPAWRDYRDTLQKAPRAIAVAHLLGVGGRYLLAAARVATRRTT